MTRKTTTTLSLCSRCSQTRDGRSAACRNSSAGRPPAHTGLRACICVGPRFLFLMETTGFLPAMGISMDCRRLLFNLCLAQDLLFWEKSNTFIGICGILVSLLCPLSLSCYCWGDFASVCAFCRRRSSLSIHYNCRFALVTVQRVFLVLTSCWEKKCSSLHFTY